MMTPEEIQQVVEDYKKSNSLNEIFNDKTKNFLRNFGRNPKDKVNIEKDKEKNGNGWFVFVGYAKNYHKENYKRRKV